MFLLTKDDTEGDAYWDGGVPDLTHDDVVTLHHSDHYLTGDHRLILFLLAAVQWLVLAGLVTAVAPSLQQLSATD